jgi:hypothetical protein
MNAVCWTAAQVKDELAARGELERRLEEMKGELEGVSRQQLEVRRSGACGMGAGLQRPRLCSSCYRLRLRTLRHAIRHAITWLLCPLLRHAIRAAAPLLVMLSFGGGTAPAPELTGAATRALMRQRHGWVQSARLLLVCSRVASTHVTALI